MNIDNAFLLTIGKKARAGRTSFWDSNDFTMRLSNYQGKKEAGLWFRTQGCSYDLQGGCFMCDYSRGSYTTPENMIDYVERGLQQIPYTCYQLLISPSGSMLDELEVPHKALVGILKLLQSSSHERFSFETRADSITIENVDLVKSYLGSRFYRLFVGLESANEWVLKYCVNKRQSVAQFESAVRILHERGVRVAANIIVSLPFLSIQENIKLAVASVKWAIEKGVEECFLFPLHIKRSTPLNILYEAGLYTPPKLWILLEIINRLGPTYYKHLRLSWYTSYGAFNVIASPDTCPVCYEKVIGLLDQFAEYQCESAIAELNKIDCECKRVWQIERDKEPTQPLTQRVMQNYQLLADRFMPAGWWQQHADEYYRQMQEDADETLYQGVCNVPWPFSHQNQPIYKKV